MMATEHEEATTTMIRLQSSDGKTFAVPVEVVRVSRTIDTMLKGIPEIVQRRQSSLSGMQN